LESRLLKILSIGLLLWAVISTSIAAYYIVSYSDINKKYQVARETIEEYRDVIKTLNESIKNIREALTGVNRSYSQLLSNYSLLLENLTRELNSGYVSLIIDFGNGNRIYRKVYVVYGENNTVFDVLVAVGLSIDYTEYPEFNDVFINCIEGVCGQQLTENSGSYWMLYINGVLSNYGAKQSIVYDGDVIEWRYETISW